MSEAGDVRWSHVLEPVTGKAVPVRRGEVLRMTLIEGPQCLDFNCFNLHDYKERLELGWTRARTPDLRPKAGDVLLSNPPRTRPLMAILDHSSSCLTHGCAAGCHRGLYEVVLGDLEHPNCWDTLGESIGEYGLTPDDVHTPFVLWMNASIGEDESWNYNAGRVPGEPGDYIDMLAVMDVLAVPVICGGANIYAGTGNYWYKPVNLEVLSATEETTALAQHYEDKFVLRTNRGPGDFAVKEIRAERELKSTGYKPQFLHYPLEIREVTLQLSDAEWEALEALQAQGLGGDAEDALRSAVMEWFVQNRVEHVSEVAEA